MPSKEHSSRQTPRRSGDSGASGRGDRDRRDRTVESRRPNTAREPRSGAGERRSNASGYSGRSGDSCRTPRYDGCRTPRSEGGSRASGGSSAYYRGDQGSTRSGDMRGSMASGRSSYASERSLTSSALQALDLSGSQSGRRSNCDRDGVESYHSSMANEFYDIVGTQRPYMLGFTFKSRPENGYGRTVYGGFSLREALPSLKHPDYQYAYRGVHSDVRQFAEPNQPGPGFRRTACGGYWRK